MAARSVTVFTFSDGHGVDAFDALSEESQGIAAANEEQFPTSDEIGNAVERRSPTQ